MASPSVIKIRDLQASASERVARHNHGVCHALQGHFLEAIGYSLDVIRIHEGLRESLSDEHKLSLDDRAVSKALYNVLVLFLIFIGNTNAALLFAEQGRARALADLMASQYTVQNVPNVKWTVRDMANFFLSGKVISSSWYHLELSCVAGL